jgi:anthranilate phosphoribosyltransferase
VGVFNLELARLYAYLYQNTKKKFIIVHNLDGYDEISLTAPFKIISEKGENIISPESMGFKKVLPRDLLGGKSIKESASIFVNVLEGKGTIAQENTVIANAAMAISCATGKNNSESIEAAISSLKNGNAMKSFKKLIETQS